MGVRFPRPPFYIMFKFTKTTVEQGAVGLAAAIFYFQKSGYNVSLPLIDNQNYDIIIEKDGNFFTVQVKTTKTIKNGGYVAQLKKVRPNKTENKISPLDKCDFVFTLCDNGDMYNIPFDQLTSRNTLTIKLYSKFKVK